MRIQDVSEYSRTVANVFQNVKKLNSYSNLDSNHGYFYFTEVRNSVHYEMLKARGEKEQFVKKKIRMHSLHRNEQKSSVSDSSKNWY